MPAAVEDGSGGDDEGKHEVAPSSLVDSPKFHGTSVASGPSVMGQRGATPSAAGAGSVHMPSILSSAAAGAGFGVAPPGRSDTAGSLNPAFGASSGSFVFEDANGAAAAAGPIEGG